MSYSSITSKSLRGRPLASQLIGGTPVYISMTTIHNRLYGVAATIETLLRGSVLPTHIYIFISAEPYLLDQGITRDFMISSSGKLRALSEAYPHISVIFTENIGPHRKLLPLLAKKWEEDCVIVTVDDHEMYPRGMLASLIDYYRASDGTAVVALRSRRMGICADAPPWRVSPYTKKHKGLWPETKPGHREMLMLPTGTGGVLYRPQFFHPIVFDRGFLNLTKTGDDLMFRLATMAKGISVVTACTVYEDVPNTCPPTGKDFGVSSQDPPVFVPQQLRSVKAADLSLRRNTTTTNAAAASLVVTTSATATAARASTSKSRSGASTTAGAPTRGRKIGGKVPGSPAPSPSSVASLSAATPTDAGSKRSVSREALSDTSLLQEEITAALEERDKAVRTLQQKKEAKIAVLNEMGSLRRRRLSARELVENGELDLSNLSEQDPTSLSSAGGTRDANSATAPSADAEDHQKDMRKKESLASKFNALGGNTVMWAQSVAYLAHMGVFDFETALQHYAPLERMPCVMLSSVFSKGAGSSNRGYLYNLLDNLRVHMQSLYSHECGILLCEAEGGDG